MTNPSKAVEAVKLEACPLCGDPMEVSVGGLIRHRDPAACLLGAYGWDANHAQAWNTRTLPPSSIKPDEADVERVARALEDCWHRLGENDPREVVWPAMAATALSAMPTRPDDGEVDGILRSVREQRAEETGFWRQCSGCVEGVDGYVSTVDYPYSEVFDCQLGGGCGDCGGIGAVWDTTDYDAMARDMLAADDARASLTRPAGGEEVKRTALREASVLLAELIGKDTSQRFYGIGGVLLGKLKTIGMTIEAALTKPAALPKEGEGPTEFEIGVAREWARRFERALKDRRAALKPQPQEKS